MFFSFDGIDGVGKSTQINLLTQWLRQRGLTVVECRDPGGTPLGERVREILLHAGEDTPIDARSEMLLYMASRAQMVEQVIRPALERGDVVVSDRYLLANVVYQGHAGGLDPDEVKWVGAIAVAGVYPDCTFVLDMDPAAASGRMQGPRDRMESRGDDYRRRLREGFLREAATDDNIHVVDASRSIEEVSRAIRQLAERLLS
jgi:dTMP kinase